VNASVPKTLVQHLIRWVASTKRFDDETSATLEAILETEISPELVPGDANDKPAQSTQQVIGPYELQDFNLYYITRFGFRPSKVAFLSQHAWRGTYDLAEIKKWLKVFLFRFFQISQFKRSCVPNAPKVGSGGSLSPRGDWRAPSDSESRAWLAELERIPE
jgi:NAD+ synthase (glutamine-hydrolysing)